MIIPALVELYNRLLEEGDATLAPKGYSRQQISFKILLTKNGTLHGFEPVTIDVPREIRKRVKGEFHTETKIEQRPAPMLVPFAGGRTSAIKPGFLCDKASYLLGFEPNDSTPDRTRVEFEAFRSRHARLANEIEDDGFKAVVRFLESWRPAWASRHEELNEITRNFGVFQLRGEAAYIHDRPVVQGWWRRHAEATTGDDDGTPRIPSLVSGAIEPTARLHEPMIRGVGRDAAALVSFNDSAYRSHAWKQGTNAPVGVDDAFKYCTALNRLTTDDMHRARIAGDTFVFWTAGKPAADAAACGWFAAALDDSAVADERLKGFIETVREGRPVKEFGDASTPFFVLGLSPNKSRLNVRLWMVSSVGDITRRVAAHHRNLELLPAPEGTPALSIRRLVNETAPLKGGFPDSDRVNPTLATDVARSILTGTAYPRAFLAGVLDRVRIEGLADSQTRKDFRAAQHRRCAVIRACLTRNHKMEVPVSLEPDRSDPPYLLGRLFAVLERIQQNALGLEINRTIKDSYYGSASATPAPIFPRLLSLSRHHLNKIENRGQRITRERELETIMDKLGVFPRMLSLEAQGLFAIGYYHQRQSYFKSKTDAE